MRIILALLASLLVLLPQGPGRLAAAEAPLRVTAAPAAPTLTSPAEGVTLTNFGPGLTWGNPAGTTQYHLQIVPANNDGPGVDVQVGSAGAAFAVPAPPNWYGLLPDMTYTWRVRVSNAPAFVSLTDPSWSSFAERRFRTPAVGSATISAVAPTNGGAVTTLTPSLQWANSRADVFYYEVQLSKDPGFNTNPATAIASVYSALLHGGVTGPKNSYAVPPSAPLEDRTKYYWRVRPRVQGDGRPVSFSAAYSFTTAVAGPDPIAGPPVIAQYYAWYDTDSFGPALTADMPVRTYNSDDPATIERQIKEARSAGIDALAVSWLGPGNRTDKNLDKIMAQGAALGMRALITFETDKPEFGDQGKIIAGLSYVRDKLFPRNTWLRVDGRPVLMFWRPSAVAVQPGQAPLDAWRSIREQVDPEHRQLWIMEGLDWDYLQVFDGQFGYSIAWSLNVANTLNSWQRRVRAQEAALGQPKIFIGTVMPGYDDTKVRPAPEGFARDRENGGYLAQTWQAAIDAGAQWVNLTSYNEWIEGSQIEPSVSYGNQYLGSNKEWSDRFKGVIP